MVFKKVLILLLFLVTIASIIAPINGTLTGYIDSEQQIKGRSTILIDVYSDIGFSNYNPNAPKYVKERKKEFSQVNTIVVNIKGYKAIILRKNTKAWNNANISNGVFTKSITIKGSPIGKNYSLRFYDKKNKLINYNKGRVTYFKQDLTLTDELDMIDKSLEAFISYFNHNKTFNMFKLKNCVSFVASKMTGTNEDQIAIQLLKTDIMMGNFKKSSIKYEDMNYTRTSELYTSSFTLKEVLIRNGRNVDSYIIKPNVFKRNFKEKDEAIFFVNNNHVILVKRSSSANWRIYDMNVNGGKPRTFTNNQFNNLLKGKNFTDNNGFSYSYDVFHRSTNGYMLLLSDSKKLKGFVNKISSKKQKRA